MGLSLQPQTGSLSFPLLCQLARPPRARPPGAAEAHIVGRPCAASPPPGLRPSVGRVSRRRRMPAASLAAPVFLMPERLTTYRSPVMRRLCGPLARPAWPPYTLRALRASAVCPPRRTDNPFLTEQPSPPPCLQTRTTCPRNVRRTPSRPHLGHFLNALVLFRSPGMAARTISCAAPDTTAQSPCLLSGPSPLSYLIFWQESATRVSGEIHK